MATQAFNALTGVSVGSNANLVIDANANAFFANVSANFANFTGNVSANNFIGNGANINGNITANFYFGDGGYLSNVGAALTVSQYTTGSLSNIVGNVSNLLFDTTTGFNVTDLGSNTALITLGSSFKTWQVAGQTSLVAVGEDTVEFVAGNNIVITTNAAAIPQQIEFALSENISITGNIVSVGDSNLGNSVTANFFIGDGGYLSNITVGAGSYISSGNSNVRVFANSNVTTSVAGNANIIVVTGTGMNVLGTLNTTGNANVGNLNIGSGVGGSLTGANSISANYFIGNGALLTGISTSPNSIFNGTSNVSIDTADGNVTVGVNGTANVFVVSNVGVTATYYNGDGNGISNIAGANVVGDVANANYATYAGTAYSVDAANVTGLGNIATINLDGNSANVLYGNGVFSTAATGTGSTISNGNSNVSIAIANGNVTTSVSGNANVVVVTGTGINVAGTLNTTGNANVGNLSVGAGVGGTVTGANSITANYFIGNGSLLTGISTSPNSIFNGTSNVSIDTADGNVTMGVNGTANVFVVANTGVTATYYNGDGNGISNIAGANVVGDVANANYATYSGTVLTNAQPNITSVGTLANLTVTGFITSEDTIYAGYLTDHQIALNTDANPGVEIGLQGRTSAGTPYIDFHSAIGSADYDARIIVDGGDGTLGTANLTINSAYVNITGNANITSNLKAGNVDFISAANVSLGNISNLHIDGGTANQVLITDGAGNVSFKTGSITVVGRAGNISIPLILS
jgi:hypothetical protein